MRENCEIYKPRGNQNRCTFAGKYNKIDCRGHILIIKGSKYGMKHLVNTIHYKKKIINILLTL